MPPEWPIACRAMNVLEITVDLGPGASPALVETLVRGVRVVADVGRDATLRRIRRAATEQMKFPTDDELARAAERLPDGSELSPRYRADNLRNARRNLAENAGGPPELFFDYWYRRGRRSGAMSYPAACWLPGMNGRWRGHRFPGRQVPLSGWTLSTRISTRRSFAYEATSGGTLRPAPIPSQTLNRVEADHSAGRTCCQNCGVSPHPSAGPSSSDHLPPRVRS